MRLFIGEFPRVYWVAEGVLASATAEYFSERPMDVTNQRLVSSCLEELYTLSRHLLQHAVAMDFCPIHYIPLR